MYRDAEGRRVTLYIRPGAGDGGERRFLFAKMEGGEALSWRSPEMSYVLAGPLDREALIRAAHLIGAPREG